MHIPKREGRSMTKEIYKVSGDRERGFRLNIPMAAYLDAMQPVAYTCTVLKNGSLIYDPVRT
jgi:hypothetical protein